LLECVWGYNIKIICGPPLLLACSVTGRKITCMSGMSCHFEMHNTQAWNPVLELGRLRLALWILAKSFFDDKLCAVLLVPIYQYRLLMRGISIDGSKGMHRCKRFCMVKVLHILKAGLHRL